MDRLKHLGIIHKGLTSYSSPVVLVKCKNQIYTEFVVTFASKDQSCLPVSQRLYRTARQKEMSLPKYDRS